jgi:hypothetical protein
MRSSSWKVAVLVSALVLGLSAAGRAEGARKHCHNGLLRGPYLGQIEGTVLSGAPGAPGPVGAVGTITFSGTGKLTIADNVSLFGTFVQRTGNGIYTVNADCTGTATVTFETPPPFKGQMQHLTMVLKRNGQMFRVISSDPGGVVLGIFEKQY